jgi:hypothetical protein
MDNEELRLRAVMEDFGMARRMRDKDFRDDQWAHRYMRQNRDLIERRGIVWLSTYHTSRQALQTPDRLKRELREASIRNALALAASVMRAPSWPAGTYRSPSRHAEAEPE